MIYKIIDDLDLKNLSDASHVAGWVGETEVSRIMKAKVSWMLCSTLSAKPSKIGIFLK